VREKTNSDNDIALGAAGQMAVFTDSHAHLSMVLERGGSALLSAVLSAYDAAWESAVKSGKPETAPRVVDPGTRADDLPDRIKAIGPRPWLRFAAGIWPDKDALEQPAPYIAALEIAAALPECVAVGEGGLDYHWMHGTKEAQKLLFEAQIALAVRLGKPLIVHSREAHGDTLGILASLRPDVPVIIHCFGYDAKAAREYLDIGCYISFAGNLTYPSAKALREACAIIPADRLLLETDSPYMAPGSSRGKLCTPLLVEQTYNAASEMRGDSVFDLAQIVTENARRIFG